MVKSGFRRTGPRRMQWPCEMRTRHWSFNAASSGNPLRIPVGFPGVNEPVQPGVLSIQNSDVLSRVRGAAPGASIGATITASTPGVNKAAAHIASHATGRWLQSMQRFSALKAATCACHSGSSI